MHVRMRVCVCACVCVCARVCVYMHVYACVCARHAPVQGLAPLGIVYTCACTCMCMHAYVHVQGLTTLGIVCIGVVFTSDRVRHDQHLSLSIIACTCTRRAYTCIPSNNERHGRCFVSGGGAYTCIPSDNERHGRRFVSGGGAYTCIPSDNERHGRRFVSGGARGDREHGHHTISRLTLTVTCMHVWLGMSVCVHALLGGERMHASPSPTQPRELDCCAALLC